jgi:hypothetical protein
MRIDMLDLQQHSMENHRAQIVHYQIDLDIHNDLEDTHDRYTIGGNTHTRDRTSLSRECINETARNLQVDMFPNHNTGLLEWYH